MDSNEYTVTDADLTVLWERHPGVQRELMIIVQQRLIKEKDQLIEEMAKDAANNYKKKTTKVI
jgi:hypothetical protein|tara:strand:+ start:2920 stop:3108 length:189 start_codon:yes stop_codon:yes gene_type:complete